MAGHLRKRSFSSTSNSPNLCRIALLIVVFVLSSQSSTARLLPRWNILSAFGGGAPSGQSDWSVSLLSYYVQVGLNNVDVGVLIDAINTTYSNSFGSTQLFAFNVTQTADPLSTQLGYIRGYTVTASYDSTFHGVEVELLQYDDGDLSGTIQLQGLINSGTNEIAIVGGTGDFRGVRGYGVITQVNSTATVVLYHHALHFL